MNKKHEVNLSPTRITIPLTDQVIAQISNQTSPSEMVYTNGTGSKRIGIENNSGSSIGSINDVSLDGKNLVVELYRLRQVDNVKKHLRK